MATCSIDAEYKGEERYSKLSLAYQTEEDKKRIDDAIEAVIPQYDIKPELYNSDVNGGKKVLVIEYHDDYDREAGAVFEKILDILQIKCV